MASGVVVFTNFLSVSPNCEHHYTGEWVNSAHPLEEALVVNRSFPPYKKKILGPFSLSLSLPPTKPTINQQKMRKCRMLQTVPPSMFAQGPQNHPFPTARFELASLPPPHLSTAVPSSSSSPGGKKKRAE